jgi:hypothetical protein
MFPVAKMRLAMWIINAAVECEYVDHLGVIVAMIRYLQLDRQDYLRYSVCRDGLRVSSGKNFERDYGIRVRLLPKARAENPVHDNTRSSFLIKTCDRICGLLSA